VIGAHVEFHERPEWLRARETPVSFACKSLLQSDAHGCDIIRDGWLTEVSVLSPDRTPAEPLAKVVYLRPAEETAARSEAALPSGLIRRPPIGQIVGIR
jgi:hypothetical protein